MNIYDKIRTRSRVPKTFAQHCISIFILHLAGGGVHPGQVTNTSRHVTQETHTCKWRKFKLRPLSHQVPTRNRLAVR